MPEQDASDAVRVVRIVGADFPRSRGRFKSRSWRLRNSSLKRNRWVRAGRLRLRGDRFVAAHEPPSWAGDHQEDQEGRRTRVGVGRGPSRATTML